MTSPLKIVINAQLRPGQGSGGIEQFLIGVIRALGQLYDGGEEYLIIGPWQEPDWLRLYTGPNQKIISGPKTSSSPVRGWKMATHLMGPLRRPIGALWRKGRQFMSSSSRRSPVSVLSDAPGFYDSLGGDVIHFPYQSIKTCRMPMIFNPHDLQHEHYPEFFTPSNLAWRKTIYPAGCQLAHTVVVNSEWVKQDVIRQYNIPAQKVQVIPVAPPTQAYSEPAPEQVKAVQSRYGLCAPFALYPATTWEHKNHPRLLKALANLRDSQGLVVQLVCTGFQEPTFWPKIKKLLGEWKLREQVQFLGIIPPDDLRAIYQLAQFVIVPTLFEANSQPVFEAWQDNAPVACSRVTSLPDQVGNAALLFDPLSVDAIAYAVEQMATNSHLRQQLCARGKTRLLDFSWKRTAQAYRAVYRRAAGRILNDEDQWLLGWDWMREPRKTEVFSSNGTMN